MRFLSITIGLLFFAFAAQPIRAQSPSFITDSLDKYIQEGMKNWDIPGLAIVVVKDGKVVVLKGYGVSDITTNQPVDANTLFMIASNSKLFTGTAIAQLEAQKKLSLNDKITKYFPEYRLYDSLSSELVTIRDMLSHRIGTKTFQGDFTFWNSALTRAEIMHKMRLLKPIGNFRQDYGYCNSCFMTAGEVIPKVTGRSWEQYVQDSLLTPLPRPFLPVWSKRKMWQGPIAPALLVSLTGFLTINGIISDLRPASSVTSQTFHTGSCFNWIVVDTMAIESCLSVYCNARGILIS